MQKLNSKPVDLIILELHYSVEELKDDLEDIESKKRLTKADKSKIDKIKLLIENDGIEKIKLKFSSYAMQILDTEFKGFTSLLKKAKDTPFDIAGKVLYAGIKAYNFEKGIEEDIIMADIRRILCAVDSETLLGIYDKLMDALPEADGNELAELEEMEELERKKPIVPQDHKKKKKR